MSDATPKIAGIDQNTDIQKENTLPRNIAGSGTSILHQKTGIS